MDLYIYSTPAEAAVELALDDGSVVHGDPCTANGRSDAHRLTLTPTTAGQGSVLRVTREGYQPFQNRGIYDPSGPRFVLDDVRLAEVAVVPTPPDPGPTPPTSHDPETIINNVYATGKHDLTTHDGCGVFTEACCDALRAQHSTMWGHILKSPGQNQYNGHAIDALYLLAGTGSGVYDIIHDSVSPNATPAYNWKDEGNPDLWYYPGADGLCLVARPTTTVLLTAARVAAPHVETH